MSSFACHLPYKVQTIQVVERYYLLVYFIVIVSCPRSLMFLSVFFLFCIMETRNLTSILPFEHGTLHQTEDSTCRKDNQVRNGKMQHNVLNGLELHNFCFKISSVILILLNYKACCLVWSLFVLYLYKI